MKARVNTAPRLNRPDSVSLVEGLGNVDRLGVQLRESRVERLVMEESDSDVEVVEGPEQIPRRCISIMQ